MDPMLEKHLGYPEQVTDIRGHLKRFAINYIVANICVAVLALFINPPQFTGLVVYFTVVHISLLKFVKAEKRVPEKHEEMKLVNGYFLIMSIFSILIVLISMLLSGQMDEEVHAAYMSPVFWVIIGVILGLVYGATMLFVRIMPPRIYKALEKKGEL